MKQDISLSGFLNSSFSKEKNITSIFKKEKLFSRKNDVYKVELASGSEIKLYVLKQYRGENRHYRIKNELFFYDLLGNNGLKVPHVYYSDEEMVIMEFMGDRTLLDYITHKENSTRGNDISESNDYFRQLPSLNGALNYIYGFNKKLKTLTEKSYVLNDMNHRNFLLPGKKVCRVDFEDCRLGIVEEDMGKFIAFFLTYNPSFTEWKRSVSESIKSYCRDTMDIDISRIDWEIEKELKKMAERRKHRTQPKQSP
jgi:tRNA A-37 threonylcarbamoyl transferase component Bud32